MIILTFKKLCRFSLVNILLASSVLVGISGLPQWVWNKDAIDSTRSGNNQFVFAGHSSNFPESASGPTKSNIRGVDGTARLIPSAIGAISNAIQGSAGGGGGGAGGLGGLVGAVITGIPQLATQAISGIFSRPPVSLPAKDPGGDFGSGSSQSSVPTTGTCRCVTANECFLPSKPSGSCEGGRVRCCSTTRTLFPDDDFKQTKSDRTVTQREIRRGLLQNILKGSGSLVDDTLDLLLTPYLTSEDQQRVATRAIGL